MPGVTVDLEALRRDFRFIALKHRLGESNALLCLVEFWTSAIRFWGDGPGTELEIGGYVPDDQFAVFPAAADLLACGLAEKRDGGIYARGAEERFKWYRQCVLAGRSRGKSAERGEDGRLRATKTGKKRAKVPKSTSDRPATDQRPTSDRPATAGAELQPFSFSLLSSEHTGKAQSGPPNPHADARGKPGGRSRLPRKVRDEARARGDEATAELLTLAQRQEAWAKRGEVATAVLERFYDGSTDTFRKKLVHALREKQDFKFRDALRETARAVALLLVSAPARASPGAPQEPELTH